MDPHFRHAERELALSLSALADTSSAHRDISPDREPSDSPLGDVAETRFAESVHQLAIERKRSHSSPVDALLSVRRDVRLTLESSPLPRASQEKLLVLATDVAVDVLLPLAGTSPSVAD